MKRKQGNQETREKQEHTKKKTDIDSSFLKDSYIPLTFEQKLGASNASLRQIKSFHTHRILKPYIRQDYETEPLKLKLLREIQQRSKDCQIKYPINYTYLQPKHVSQVNRLAEEFFWSGIDGTLISRFFLFMSIQLFAS